MCYDESLLEISSARRYAAVFNKPTVYNTVTLNTALGFVKFSHFLTSPCRICIFRDIFPHGQFPGRFPSPQTSPGAMTNWFIGLRFEVAGS